jgi:hypothetical protein
MPSTGVGGMFILTFRAALAAAAVMLALPGQAWCTPFEPAPLGTRLFISSGGYVEIDSVEGTVVRTVNAWYSSRAWYGMCLEPVADQKFNAKELDALWPLAAGKTVSVEVDKGDKGEWRWAWTFTVVRREAVTTPLGQSDAWLIEVTSKGLSHEYEAKTSCWYDPAIGFPIKRVVKILRGQGNASAWHVTRVERRDYTKRVEYQVPTPGTIFTTTEGRAYTVTGTRNHATLVHTNGRDYTYVGGLLRFAPDQITEQREERAAAIWPIEVGKQTRIEGGRGLVVYVHDVTVEARETVTVPAGTFATYRIRWTERSIGARSPEIVRTIWYSPALHFPVKHVDQQDGVARYSWELRSVTRPKIVEAARN